MQELVELDKIIEEITGNLSPKIIAIFQGVVKLLNEKEDIALIKVADITSAAGIGKGTAYEYFSNKEEIIIKAMAYDLAVQIGKIRKTVFQKHGFEEKLFAAFDWIQENFEKKTIFFKYIHSERNQKQGWIRLAQEIDPRLLDCANYGDIFNNIIESGRKEGILKKEQNKFIIDTVLMVATSVLFHYLSKQEYAEEITYDSVKRYAYHILIKVYNDILM